MNLTEYYNAYWQEHRGIFDQARLDLMIERVKAGEKVLVVDCGLGVLAQQLREKGATVIGTDFSPVALQRAREKGFPLFLVDPDEEPLPFKDGSFDTVVSDSAIEHHFFPHKSLDECVRVLRKGGKLLLCLPNIAHWRFRLWLLAGRFPYIKNTPTDFTHIRFFTLHEVREQLRRRGVLIKEVDGSASLWVKGLYPPFLRRRMRRLYTWLARRFPSLFARDLVILGIKERGNEL